MQCKSVDGIDLAQERDNWQTLVQMVMILQIAQNEGNSLPSFGSTSFSKRPLFHGVI
jgi:hypothetical protein